MKYITYVMHSSGMKTNAICYSDWSSLDACIPIYLYMRGHGSWIKNEMIPLLYSPSGKHFCHCLHIYSINYNMHIYTIMYVYVYCKQWKWAHTRAIWVGKQLTHFDVQVPSTHTHLFSHHSFIVFVQRNIWYHYNVCMCMCSIARSQSYFSTVIYSIIHAIH